MQFFIEKHITEEAKMIDFPGNFDQRNSADISEKIEYHLQFLNDKKRINTVSYTVELLSIFARNAVDIFRNDCKFWLSYNDSFIFLYTSGIFKEFTSSGFKIALDEINESINDKQKLQELYREKLGNFTIDDRSGLGLLGIARRVGNPLLYNFEPFEENYTCFELIVKINI
jgi:hypothetical protein